MSSHLTKIDHINDFENESPIQHYCILLPLIDWWENVSLPVFTLFTSTWEIMTKDKDIQKPEMSIAQ